LWLPIIDDQTPHLQYQNNLELFKTDFKIWINIHFKVVKGEYFTSEEILKTEQEELGIDLKSI